jgi:geranylgeranyl diphosphate synthase type I
MSLVESARRVAPPAPAFEPRSNVVIEQVEASMIRLAAGSHLERCGAMVVEHLTTGGKRIRARLALSAYGALGGWVPHAVPWAAACELLHNASLVHDDLQDGDRMRRGAPTLWVRHGRAQAINAGDLLLMLPTLALDELHTDDAIRWRLSRGLARYAADTVRGQSLEMTLLASGRFDWADYARSATGKTAGFFGLPIYGAAILAGRSEADATTFANEFERIGLLFQLQDDVIDLFGEKGRDAVGADVREGKVSALVVEHLQMYPAETDWLRSVLEADRDDTTDEQVRQVTRRFRDGGALEEVLERIYELASATYRSEVFLREPALRQLAVATLDQVLAHVRALDFSLPVDELSGEANV